MKRILLISFVLMAALISEAWAQRTVSGTVTSGTSQEGLPGVAVRIKGTSLGVTTNFDGEYRIEVPEGQDVLIFSFLGFNTEEIAIGNRSVIDVELMEDIKQLQEVVVVGYGTQSERFSTQNVSTINNETIENVPVISTQEILQGQAAGVQMTSSSGVAGSQPNVRIRGVASITAGGSPLYVIDGVPLNDASSADYSSAYGTQTALNPLTELNPNEIKSITVLKDASAVAIYGSRGANGVILIETKKGIAGQTRVNIETYTGIQQPTTIRDYMSVEQYNQYTRELLDLGFEYPRAAYFPILTEEDIPEGGYDWPGNVTRDGRVSSLNVSASGGSENTQFFLSGTHFDNKGYIIGNDFNRTNARLNLTHSFSDRIKIGANIGLARTNNDRIASDNETGAPMTSSFLAPPWLEPYDDAGNFVNTGFIQNVFAIEALSTFELLSERTTGNAYIEAEVLPNLTFRTDFGIDQIQTEEKFRDPELVSPGGYAYSAIRQDNKWLTSNTLSYENNFGENHYFNVLGGYSYEESDFSSIVVEGTGFVSDQLPNVGSAATPTTTSEIGSGWRLNSFFGRMNYRLKDRYLLEASIRRDGSSRFGLENRFGTFWAASAGWILTEESIFQDMEFLSFLKLSTSYGIAGNDRIGNFASRGLYQGGTLGDYAGIPGLYPTQPENPNLGWEETAQFDVTLNAAFIDDRINLEVSYYNKETTGLLLDVPQPYTTGYSTITRNAGEMVNRGIDFRLQTVNIRKGDFEWTTDLNFGYLENEVTSLPGASVDDEGRRFIAGSGEQRAIEGYSVNTFYQIRYKGINSETGDAEWYTKDGEITTDPSQADRVIVGSAIPDFTGGFRNTLKYKGFDFSAFFTFTAGNKIFFGEYDGFLWNYANVGTFNMDPSLLNYWKEPGDDAFAPSPLSETAGYFDQASTLQLMDGDYLRLKNLSLGYVLPKSWIEETRALRSARIYVQAQNLITFTGLRNGLEPETSDGGNLNQIQGESFFTPPQAKSYTVGISIGL